jgi:Domain of unknown function (DUF4340)
MKRTTLVLIAVFLLLGGSAWLILKKKRTFTGSVDNPDMQFAVKNPEIIAKIFIADRKNGKTATIEKKTGYWLYNGQYTARPSAVELLLKTIKEVNVYYIPPKVAEENMIQSLILNGIKVEMFDADNKKIKCYYVGGVTNDERGTFMIMEGAERPYVVHIPSFVGQLRVRYFLGDDNWRDRTVFSEKPEDIQSITVEYPKEKAESFRLEKTDAARYAVSPLFEFGAATVGQPRKGTPEAYLVQFEKRVAEAFETANTLRDSITALPPFAIITLKNTAGTEKTVRFWPADARINRDNGQVEVDRYFAEVDRKDFMLVQDRNFGPLFQGYRYFYEGKAGGRLAN